MYTLEVGTKNEGYLLYEIFFDCFQNSFHKPQCCTRGNNVVPIWNTRLDEEQGTRQRLKKTNGNLVPLALQFRSIYVYAK